MNETPADAMLAYFGYRRADKAIDFLCEAFGFRVLVRYDTDDGQVMHAELARGSSVVMLGTGTDEQRDASRTGEAATRGLYLVTDDVDAAFARATAAGASVVWAPHDTEFGTRRCRVLDLEGYEWSFGSYRPVITDA